MRKQRARQQLGGEANWAQKALIDTLADRSPQEARIMLRRWQLGLLAGAVALSVLGVILYFWAVWAGIVVHVLAVAAFLLWFQLRRNQAGFEAMADLVGSPGGRGGERPPRARGVEARRETRTGGKAGGGKTGGGKTAGGKALEAKASGGKTAGGKASEARPSGGKGAGGKAPEGKGRDPVAETRAAAEAQAGGPTAAGARGGDARPAGEPGAGGGPRGQPAPGGGKAPSPGSPGGGGGRRRKGRREG
jgi:hypothetical protein